MFQDYNSIAGFSYAVSRHPKELLRRARIVESHARRNLAPYAGTGRRSADRRRTERMLKDTGTLVARAEAKHRVFVDQTLKALGFTRDQVYGDILNVDERRTFTDENYKRYVEDKVRLFIEVFTGQRKPSSEQRVWKLRANAALEDATVTLEA